MQTIPKGIPREYQFRKIPQWKLNVRRWVTIELHKQFSTRDTRSFPFSCLITNTYDANGVTHPERTLKQIIPCVTSNANRRAITTLRASIRVIASLQTSRRCQLLEKQRAGNSLNNPFAEERDKSNFAVSRGGEKQISFGFFFFTSKCICDWACLIYTKSKEMNYVFEQRSGYAFGLWKILQIFNIKSIYWNTMQNWNKNQHCVFRCSNNLNGKMLIIIVLKQRK